MFTISGSPANTVLRPIVDLLAYQTPSEVEQFVREYYDEEWFSSTTPSLRGNDNRLNHKIRSIRAQMGITNGYSEEGIIPPFFMPNHKVLKLLTATLP